MEHLAVVLQASIKGIFPFYSLPFCCKFQFITQHKRAFKAVCKAFHNGRQLSAGSSHTHTHTLTQSYGGKKANGLWGSPGDGRGAGHANDLSLDIWGEGGGVAIRTAGGEFFRPKWVRFNPHKKCLKYCSFKTDWHQAKHKGKASS